MAKLPDHYAVLNVAPTSDEVVIAAAYKALMKKYHPDANPDAATRSRATAINLAFEVLGNPEKRAAYDRALRSGQTARDRQMPPPPPTPPPRTQEAPGPSKDDKPPSFDRTRLIPLVVVGTILLGAIAFGAGKPTEPAPKYIDTTVEDVTVENTSAPSGFANPYDGASMSEAGNTVADLSIFESPAYQSPTALEFADIERGANDFVREFKRGGLTRARGVSERCHKGAVDKPSWPILDRCAAFDFAAAYTSARLSKTNGTSPNAYFQFQLENQIDYYRSVGGPYAQTRERLASIRRSAEPIADQNVSALDERDDFRADPEPGDLELNLGADD